MRVTIDCFWDQLDDYPAGSTIVAVDVIRAATTAITAVVDGRRCFVAAGLDAASRRQSTLPNPFMLGELGGNMPYGFDATNSPVAVTQLGHPERPLVLLSSSGTTLMAAASGVTDAAYVACLRNWEAQAASILRRSPESVVLLGAGTRGEFREEDQLCCAWIGGRLLAAGAEVDADTSAVIERWRGAPVDAIGGGNSAAYLRSSGQLHDLQFILDHVNDVDAVFVLRGDEVCDDRGPAVPSAVGD
jgi:2-phosphosulfolactate phosphatase